MTGHHPWPPTIEYRIGPENEYWWCNSHNRRATHIDSRERHCCAPNLGGIMIPCDAVNLTNIMEIEGDAGTKA
ncbi:MAG TPA: hypothetical protein VEP90_17385 [Methylomirabilota bacterium]|nr:hypothetical protein [Methylomirabilota bacterium]